MRYTGDHQTYSQYLISLIIAVLTKDIFHAINAKMKIVKMYNIEIRENLHLYSGHLEPSLVKISGWCSAPFRGNNFLKLTNITVSWIAVNRCVLHYSLINRAHRFPRTVEFRAELAEFGFLLRSFATELVFLPWGPRNWPLNFFTKKWYKEELTDA